MFMDLGAAFGMCARMVVDAGGPDSLAVQDVNVTDVHEPLVQQYKQRVRGPYF